MPDLAVIRNLTNQYYHATHETRLGLIISKHAGKSKSPGQLAS